MLLATAECPGTPQTRAWLRQAYFGTLGTSVATHLWHLVLWVQGLAQPCWRHLSSQGWSLHHYLGMRHMSATIPCHCMLETTLCRKHQHHAEHVFPSASRILCAWKLQWFPSIRTAPVNTAAPGYACPFSGPPAGNCRPRAT